MTLKNLLAPALLLCIMGCSQTTKNYVLKVKLQQLNELNMYDRDLVYDVIFDSEEQGLDSLQTKSRQLFLQGIDQYKNKNNPSASIDLFKKSILVFPDAKTYYELGNALVDSKRGEAGLEEAIKAYEVADRLQFQPLSMIYYNLAVARYQQSMINEDEDLLKDALDNLSAAFEKGFSDTTVINGDSRIAAITYTPRYRSMINQLNRNTKENAHSLFEQFKSSFPLVSQPFEIPVEKVSMSDYNTSISYDFSAFIPEMENSVFSRSVSNDFFFVGRVAETPAYTAVIYSSTSFGGEEMQPVATRLVTYDNTGKIIAGKLFSCQCSAEKIKKARIENSVITVEDYKRTWKKAEGDIPFERVDKYELLSTAKFRIKDDGSIVEESVPANYSDSSLMVLQPAE